MPFFKQLHHLCTFQPKNQQDPNATGTRRWWGAPALGSGISPASHPWEQSQAAAQKMPGNGFCSLPQRGRGKGSREVCQGKWCCYTQGVFFGCLFPSPRPGCRAGFGSLSRVYLGVCPCSYQVCPGEQNLANKSLSPPFVHSSCAWPGVGVCTGWDWVTINVCKKTDGFFGL